MNAGATARWRGMRVVARGANRVCVLDPDLPGYCLKYELEPLPGMRRYWRRRLRHALSARFPRLGSNGTELAAWRRLHARLGDALHEHVAPCTALVATPAGRALRCGLVTGDDDQAAPTIATLLAEDPATLRFDPVALCRALDELETWLLAHRIPLPDLNAGNLAVVEHQGRPRLVSIDVKSTLDGKELVPLSRWSWTLMRRKIQRRCGRLRQRIEAVRQATALADPPGLP